MFNGHGPVRRSPLASCSSFRAPYYANLSALYLGISYRISGSLKVDHEVALAKIQFNCCHLADVFCRTCVRVTSTTSRGINLNKVGFEVGLHTHSLFLFIFLISLWRYKALYELHRSVIGRSCVRGNYIFFSRFGIL